MCLTFLSVDHFFTSHRASIETHKNARFHPRASRVQLHPLFPVPFSNSVLCKRVWSGGSSDKWLNAKRLRDHIATPVLQAAQNAADAAGAYPF